MFQAKYQELGRSILERKEVTLFHKKTYHFV
jgi:hypothetical protein